MSRDLVIGIDLGTTACKVIAVRPDGMIEATASSDHPLHVPQPGRAEQDVGEVMQSMSTAMHRLMDVVSPDRVAGLCFSGAMHSLLPVDAADRPMSRAITWADLRAVESLGSLPNAADARELHQRTGCPPQWPYWPAKLRWLARHQPKIATSAVRFVAIKDWVIHQLTGVWATDIGMASATGLLDLRTHDWCDAALQQAGITADRLPPLASPHQIIGTLDAQGASRLRLPPGLPVMPGGGDGGLANLGAGGAKPGSVVITVGTSGAVRITTDQPLIDEDGRIWCYALTQDRWYAGGAINNGGLAVETMRRLLFADDDKKAGFDAFFDEAARIAPGSDGVIVLPYFNGERNPHWRPDLRASIHGLGASHTRAHIARATLEAVAYCLADVWRIVRDCGDVHPDRIRLTGGITRSRLWSQIVCDILGLPVLLSEAGDASARGAAMIGHWGLGHVASLAAFPLDAGACVTLTPDPVVHAACQGHHAAFGQALMRALS